MYLDQTIFPDSLKWTLDLLNGGKLGAMLEKAGYLDHASRLNPTILLESMETVSQTALKMEKEASQS